MANEIRIEIEEKVIEFVDEQPKGGRDVQGDDGIRRLLEKYPADTYYGKFAVRGLLRSRGVDLSQYE